MLAAEMFQDGGLRLDRHRCPPLGTRLRLSPIDAARD
jgi:hypothetical protein